MKMPMIDMRTLRNAIPCTISDSMDEDDLPYWMARVHGLCGNNEGGANDAD